MPARAIAGLLFVLVLSLIAPVVTQQPARAQSTFEYIATGAVADFPNDIFFSMSARTDVEVSEARVFWRAAGASAMTVGEATFTGQDVIEASYLADMSVLYLPPGLDIEYYWVVTDPGGQSYESDIQTLFYIDTRFDWQSRQAGLVNVWWYSGPDDYADEIAHAANSTLIRLEEQFGISTSEPVRIIMYANERDFSGALRPNSAEWIGGVAYSSLSLIIAHVAPGGNAQREIERMIPHEVSHVAVHHASENPYNSPSPWLDEGLATYIQQVEDPRLEPTLDRAVREGRLIPAGALRSSFPLDADQALLSYAQSLSLVTYLVETYGRAQVGDLVNSYRGEVTHDQAVEQTFGITMEELDAGWKTWLGYDGDRDPATALENATPAPFGISWFAALIGGTLVLVLGFIAFLFWRTRQYAETDDEETAAETA